MNTGIIEGEVTAQGLGYQFNPSESRHEIFAYCLVKTPTGDAQTYVAELVWKPAAEGVANPPTFTAAHGDPKFEEFKRGIAREPEWRTIRG